jgi:hypothetical protein
VVVRENWILLQGGQELWDINEVTISRQPKHVPPPSYQSKCPFSPLSIGPIHCNDLLSYSNNVGSFSSALRKFFKFISVFQRMGNISSNS